MKSSARLLVLTSFSLLTMTDVVGQVQGGDFGDHNAVYLPAGGDSSIGRCANEAPDKVIRFSLKGAGRMKAVLGAPNEYKGKASVAKRDLGWSWTNTTQAARTTLFTAPTDPAEGVGLNSNNNGQSPVLHTNYPATPEQLGAIVVDAIRPGGQSPTLSTKPGEGFRLYFDKWATCPGHPEEPNWLYYWKQLPIIDSMIQALPPVYLLDVSEGRCDSVEARVPIRFVYNEAMTVEVQAKQKSIDPNSVVTRTEIVPDDYVDGQGGSSSKLNSKLRRTTASSITACANLYANSDSVLLNTRFTDSLTISVGIAAALKYKKNSVAGLASFIEIVRHELQHINIGLLQTEGRMSIRDSDSDGYADDWERRFENDFPKYFGDSIRFVVGKDDSYRDGYKERECFGSVSEYQIDPREINFERCRMGTIFEEYFIRDNATWMTRDQLRPMDWSYDNGQTEIYVPQLDTMIKLGTQGLQW